MVFLPIASSYCSSVNTICFIHTFQGHFKKIFPVSKIILSNCTVIGIEYIEVGLITHLELVLVLPNTLNFYLQNKVIDGNLAVLFKEENIVFVGKKNAWHVKSI